MPASVPLGLCKARIGGMGTTETTVANRAKTVESWQTKSFWAVAVLPLCLYGPFLLVWLTLRLTSEWILLLAMPAWPIMTVLDLKPRTTSIVSGVAILLAAIIPLGWLTTKGFRTRLAVLLGTLIYSIAFASLYYLLNQILG